MMGAIAVFGITTQLADVGTPEGVQLPELFQSLLTEAFHVLELQIIVMQLLMAVHAILFNVEVITT